MQKEFSGTVSDLGEEYSGFTGNMARTRVALQISSAIGVGAFLLIAVNVFGSRGPELLLLVLITARLVPQCSLLNQYVHHLLHNLPAFSTVMQALDDCRDTPDAPESGANDVVHERSIELRNVTVSGSGASGTPLLTEVSLEIRAGDFVVIQGPSGAGKSTLADVISGLLPVESGEMCIDGTALSPLDLRAWRRSVGYVPQHSAMLRDTVMQNLSWVLRTSPGAADVQRALRCAEAERIVAALPEGLDTLLSRREDRLSGGERQRISLARELLRQPRLLILDEAMNALDPATESRVLENLRAWRPELTVVIISHRPGSVAFADRVIMLDSGRIISDKKQTTSGGGRSQHA
jgi:ATP-binding cassette subfamily C protein